MTTGPAAGGLSTPGGLPANGLLTGGLLTGAPITTLFRPDVLIIGGGPAGLTAAADLARRLEGDVLVLDREDRAGGVPRMCPHAGYGLRDLRRVTSGPDYAQRLVERAIAAGAQVRARTTVTGWSGDRRVEVTSPQGRFEVEARAVVLATGARERPRAARFIPGDRPDGVWTTGQLQRLVHTEGGEPARPVPIGTRAVVVGAEAVSWSAVLTLRAAGCATELMTTTYPKAESSAAFTLPGRTVLRVPVVTSARVTRIVGTGRVEAVEIENLVTGARRLVACDTVVLTGDWIPDHELARSAGLDLDPGTRGPLVDTALRTSRPGIFAAGNLLHPVDTADVAALDGRHVAVEVARWLEASADEGAGAPSEGGGAPSEGVRLVAERPLRWVTPGILRPGDPGPPRGRLLAWSDAHVRTPRVRVGQDGVVLSRRTLPWPAAPGRVFRIPASMLDGVDRTGGPVYLGLT